MRDIKFRAWDKQENEWYEPTFEAYRGKLWELLISFRGDLVAHTVAGLEHQSLWPERYILMQYTGLKDKNGKEIYEGDIVRDSVGQNYEVIFDKGEFTKNWPNLWLDERRDEVVGNIWENSKLLEEQKQ
jgi:uncharacterized phage protein (TIGR01671 family)